MSESIKPVNIQSPERVKEAVRLCIALFAAIVLSACATVTPANTVSGKSGKTVDDQTVVDLASQQAQADSVADAVEADAELAFDPDLPLLELDADLLGELLISNLASYQGKWAQGSRSALSAAKSSQDYRIARIATLLALRARDYTTAADSADLWLTLKSDSDDAANVLVLSQVGAGQVDNALATLTIQQGDKSIDRHIRQVSGLLVRQGNATAALDVVSHYVNQHPDSAQVLISSAFVAETFGNEEQATQWTESALTMRPDWDLAAQMKARLLQRQGRLEERSQYIQEYVKNHPASVNMRISYAAELARQEQYQRALELMQETLLEQPNNVAVLSYAAALAEQLEDVPSAKKYYTKALRQDARNDGVRWALARIAVSEENYAKAESLFDDITSVEQYFSAQLQVANMRYRTKDLKSALRTLAVLEPVTEGQYIEVALARHFLLMRDHQYDRALGYINESIIYLPDNLELLYSRALVAAELEKLEIAEADFRKIINAQPEHANALNALGYTLADQTDRLDEARGLIVKALELRPNDAHILDSMGWVAYRQDDLDMAIEFLQKAYDASPESEIAAHLGEVLWESGEQLKARQIWQESYQQDNSNPLLIETLERYGVSFDEIESNSVSGVE